MSRRSRCVGSRCGVCASGCARSPTYSLSGDAGAPDPSGTLPGEQEAAMRRRIPWWVLALLFVVVPVLEIYVLIQVGQVIGAWWTILLLVADGFLGSWLMKHEGSKAWRALREALDERRIDRKSVV